MINFFLSLFNVLSLNVLLFCLGLFFIGYTLAPMLYYKKINIFLTYPLWLNKTLEKWIEENPPAIGNAWEPYTISLRVVNWIKWALKGNTLKDSYTHSLAIQVRYLQSSLEIHLLGNHLIANAKALFFAGLFFFRLQI